MDRVLTFEWQHEEFRESFGAFLDREAVPYYDEWCRDHQVPHSYFEKMGQAGFMATWVDKRFGGLGCAGDYRYTVVKAEEYAKRGLNGIFSRLSGDVVALYIGDHGTEEQKQKWLPKVVKGETVLGVCMTEPNYGSDLANIQASAVDCGDYYLVNGSKTFISNGMVSDLLVVAVRTDPKASKPHKGISLLLIETDREGVSRSLVEKIGLHCQDTAEIGLQNVKVPKENLLGEENRGFYILMKHLEEERIMASYAALTQTQHTLELTKEYVSQRVLFGKPLSSFQNTQFKLAQLYTEYTMALTTTDQLLKEYMAGKKNINTDCSMMKYYATELSFRAADVCAQLFGGYGICSEVPVARQLCDARISRYMGGTSETQLSVIAGGLGIH